MIHRYFAVAALLAGFVGALHGQRPAVPDSQLSGVRIKTELLPDQLLGWMLTSGRRIDLSKLPNAPRGVEAAIWEAPFEGTCVEGTHLVCGHRYLLIVSGDGIGLGPHTFDLGYLGVLTPRGWDPSDTTDYWSATLRVDVVNYPEDVFRSTPGVARVHRHYSLKINALEGKLTVKGAQ